MDNKDENQDSLEGTRKFFQNKYEKEISLEEAREINMRIVKYFKILAKWDRMEKQTEEEERELPED